MVLEALFGSAALGTTGIWGYNRENFLYDREMRQEQEFQVIDMRLAQVNLWRDDVREMIGLTEKKMDVYMVVNALQLGFTVTLFTEGRLEPGTPEWLLWLYMLSLAGAFTLLLASVWFAMHASVAAQGNAVRLLTQFVRPPIPSWEQLEATRTYGHAFEGIPAQAMMRVPLLQTISEGSPKDHHHGPEYGHFQDHDDEASSSSIDDSEEPSEASATGPQAADPWGLERRGDGVYELQRRPLTANRHTHLVREASKQWQAYDAFARASMTLGTIHLCSALSYYILGYVLIQDGSPWAAVTTVIIFLGISAMILRLDLSLTRREHMMAKAFLMGGPSMASLAAIDWATYSPWLQEYSLMLVPVAYVSHILFLHRFLRLCHVVKQPGGSLLPMSFRSVLYLDIFGWLLRFTPARTSEQWSPRSDDVTKDSYSPVDEAVDNDPVHNIEPGVFQVPELNGTLVCPTSQSGCMAASACTAAATHGTGSITNDSAAAELEQDARSPKNNVTNQPRVRFSFSRDSQLARLQDETDSSSGSRLQEQESPHLSRRMSVRSSVSNGRARGSGRDLRRLSVSANQTFPKHTLRFGSSPAPLRPEDVDTSVLSHGDPHG